MRIAAYRRKKELGMILPFENISAAGNQTSLQVVEAKSLYTTSAEEREMVCFLFSMILGSYLRICRNQS